MKGSRTNGSYNHSHQKTHKSEAKYLTRTGTPDTIFSGKRHKRAVCLHKNTPKQHTFFSKQPWFSKGAASPLSPRLKGEKETLVRLNRYHKMQT